MMTEVERREDVNPNEGLREYSESEFADPINKKYPIDNPDHVRAAWRYINKNARKTTFRLRFRAVYLVLTAAATTFRALMEARHRAIHFNPATAERDREFAVEALRHLDEIITIQFGASGLQPWFILDSEGVQFIKKDWEANPFVKLVYIPASLLVGPNHWIDIKDGVWTIYDQEEYEDREVSDEDYIRMYEEFTQRRIGDATVRTTDRPGPPGRAQRGG